MEGHEVNLSVFIKESNLFGLLRKELNNHHNIMFSDIEISMLLWGEENNRAMLCNLFPFHLSLGGVNFWTHIMDRLDEFDKSNFWTFQSTLDLDSEGLGGDLHTNKLE